METQSDACRSAALSFTQHLAEGAYEAAYAMTSQEYRTAVTLEQMKDEFEAIVPLDWGDIDPIEIVETMSDRPAQRGSDPEWITVSIGGDVYSESLNLMFALEDDEPRIREIGFGRP